MLKYSVSRFITMNVFGGSQAGDTKRIISDIQSSTKTILNDLKLQQKEIDNIKSNIHENYSSLLNCENRVSELFNNHQESITKLSIISEDIDHFNKEIERLNTNINRITGLYDENSLPNLGSYISDLNSRLKIIEGNYIKKN
jgi:chromosome segregation ATPase